MAKFNYKAKNTENKTTEGLVEADNLKQASDLLHDKGYYIITIKEHVQNILAFDFAPQGVSFQEIVHFTRQLSTMITAGLNLDEALLILMTQVKKSKLENIIKKIEEEVRSGKAFTL